MGMARGLTMTHEATMSGTHGLWSSQAELLQMATPHQTADLCTRSQPISRADCAKTVDKVL
jgi:hypothetical protein